MLSLKNRIALSLTLVCSFALAACAADTDPDDAETTLEVESAVRNDDYTTRDVCKACGCIATMVACNCGMPPSKKKLECLRNGGPTKVQAPVGAFGGGAARVGARSAPASAADLN